jgi:hypothetical protein
MNLKEEGCEDVAWMHVAQDKDGWRTFVNMVMNLWVPLEASNFLTG